MRPTTMVAKATSQKSASTSVPLSDIDRSDRAHRVRLELDSEGLKSSLAEHGQLVPIILRQVTSPGRLQIVAGFRRLTAIKALGWARVDAVVVTGISDTEAFDMAVVENSQRQDFTDLDRGNAVLMYRHRFGRGLDEIARIMGLQRRQVARLEQLTTLPMYVQLALTHGGVPTTHVLVLMDHFDPVAAESSVRRWLVRLRDTRMSVVSLRQELLAERDASRSGREGGRSVCGWYIEDGRTIRLRSTTFQLDAMPPEERQHLADQLEALALRLRGHAASA